MSNILKIAGAGVSAAAEETDENFNQTVLLLHGDGTNGAQNNTFLDSSSNNFTITKNGNTTQGTFSPFSAPDGRWSNYFDGVDDKITTPSSADFGFGTGDFHISLWVYLVSDANKTIFGNVSDNLNLYVAATTKYIGLWTGSVNDSTTVAPVNQWAHFVVTRTGTTLQVYMNGSSILSITNSTNFATTSYIIGNNAGSSYINAYISNFKIVKGSPWTPTSNPTTPSTSDTNTKLLTCQSNRFVDTNTQVAAKTLTPAGGVKVTPFSPFAPTAAYDSAVNGGSGYFDGSGDYLDLAQNSAFNLSGDFTIELWWYATASTNPGYLFDFRVSGSTTLAYIYQNDKIDFYLNGSQYITSLGETNPYYRWNHFVATRSGSTLSIYHNGKRVNTATNSSTGANSTVRIGGRTGGTELWNGYLSDFRIVNGSSVYDPTSTAITVPTAPPTNITNTSLLCNFTNAGIFDNTGKNNLETVGNAQIDTTTKKFGTGSMEFDGTGDVLIVPYSQDINISSGDFTLEAWVYYTNATSFFHVFAMWDTSNLMYQCYIATSNNSIEFSTSSNGSTSTALTSSSSVISPSTWTHLAIVRSAGTVTVYVNGSSVASGARTIFNGTSKLSVGGRADGSFYGTGFVDDLRITKGVARYTTTFTPPTKAFADL